MAEGGKGVGGANNWPPLSNLIDRKDWHGLPTITDTPGVGWLPCFSLLVHPHERWRGRASPVLWRLETRAVRDTSLRQIQPGFGHGTPSNFGVQRIQNFSSYVLYAGTLHEKANLTPKWPQKRKGVGSMER